jgi:putative membrane protein
MSAVVAFLHHGAAFTLVAALVLEWVLVNEPLTMAAARRLRLADLVFGASAAAVLVFGALRVMYFEKGPTYYLHSAPFIAKLTLFAIVGLISIYPTAEFLSWRNALVRDQVPTLPDTKRR